MLYMLFFASCIHYLKKSQLETKRFGNKRQAYNYKKSSLVLLTNLRSYDQAPFLSGNSLNKYCILSIVFTCPIMVKSVTTET